MNPATLAYILAGLKILDEIIRLISDRVLAAHTTVQAVTNAIKALAAWVSRSGPAAGAVALALLLASSPALADGPQLRAPMPADIAAAPAVPVVASEPTAPPVLTLSGFAACSAKAAADCLANPTAPPADSRAYYTSLLAGTIPPLVNLAAILWLKLDPTPIGK